MDNYKKKYIKYKNKYIKFKCNGGASGTNDTIKYNDAEEVYTIKPKAECIICTELLTSKDIVALAGDTCQRLHDKLHLFHKECIVNWYKSRRGANSSIQLDEIPCPSCRCSVKMLNTLVKQNNESDISDANLGAHKYKKSVNMPVQNLGNTVPPNDVQNYSTTELSNQLFGDLELISTSLISHYKRQHDEHKKIFENTPGGFTDEHTNYINILLSVILISQYPEKINIRYLDVSPLTYTRNYQRIYRRFNLISQQHNLPDIIVSFSNIMSIFNNVFNSIYKLIIDFINRLINANVVISSITSEIDLQNLIIRLNQKFQEFKGTYAHQIKVIYSYYYFLIKKFYIISYTEYYLITDATTNHYNMIFKDIYELMVYLNNHIHMDNIPTINIQNDTCTDFEELNIFELRQQTHPNSQIRETSNIMTTRRFAEVLGPTEQPMQQRFAVHSHQHSAPNTYESGPTEQQTQQGFAVHSQQHAAPNSYELVPPTHLRILKRSAEHREPLSWHSRYTSASSHAPARSVARPVSRPSPPSRHASAVNTASVTSPASASIFEPYTSSALELRHGRIPVSRPVSRPASATAARPALATAARPALRLASRPASRPASPTVTRQLSRTELPSRQVPTSTQAPISRNNSMSRYLRQAWL